MRTDLALKEQIIALTKSFAREKQALKLRPLTFKCVRKKESEGVCAAAGNMVRILTQPSAFSFVKVTAASLL